MPLPEHFQINSQPIADPKAVVQAPGVRFTMLTSRLIRLEYSPDEHFEDRPSQIFWYRLQPAPDFEIRRDSRKLEIITSHLHLRYQLGHPFHRDTLSIEVIPTGVTWHFGDSPRDNLGGTARTLDNVDGQAPLEPGLLSRQGWTLIDDSHSLVFKENGFLGTRKSPNKTLDVYFFGYAHAFQDCIADFYKVSGPVALLPRWALGNWWSRFWAYTQEELGQLMLDFQSQEIPLSVCIIDMDWHLTKTGNQCSGWTGFTWNKALFPDPAKFLSFLTNLGLKKALNLHPAEGVHPHEQDYPTLARAMGIDPQSGQPVRFDPEDPKFIEAYFKIQYHPQESQGVDFWWLDWQQGNPSRLPNLNLLWWINHLHFFDHGRDPQRRGMIFSRWGGLGNHRYPIGFSGDTYITWDSLAFQPYFTATASNVGYSWWSHDIGGHMGGVEEPELYARWVQYGVFSPIFRLHSTNNPFHERRPWGFDAETFRVTRNAMQLRHRLIPYIYSMAWKNHHQGIPLVRPMYHLHPEDEQAYSCPNQYAFGSELIAAPFISRADPDTRLSRQVVWLPPGEWFDFFSGTPLHGGRWLALYGGLEDIPVFARAGAIVPLAEKAGWGDVAHPDTLSLHIFPGNNNRFELFEDDGESQAYLAGDYAITPLTRNWSVERQTLCIEPAQGNPKLLPSQRTYKIIFHAIHNPGQVRVTSGGKSFPVRYEYFPQDNLLEVQGIVLSPADELVVELSDFQPPAAAPDDPMKGTVRRYLRAFRLSSYAKQSIAARLAEILINPDLLAAYQTALSHSQMRCLVETLFQAGIHHHTTSGEDQVVLWNNTLDPRITFQTATEDLTSYDPLRRFSLEKEKAPAFKVYRREKEFQDNPVYLRLLYSDIFEVAVKI